MPTEESLSCFGHWTVIKTNVSLEIQCSDCRQHKIKTWFVFLKSEYLWIAEFYIKLRINKLYVYSLKVSITLFVIL